MEAYDVVDVGALEGAGLVQEIEQKNSASSSSSLLLPLKALEVKLGEGSHSGLVRRKGGGRKVSWGAFKPETPQLDSTMLHLQAAGVVMITWTK